MPIISIIIPIYNAERHLKECLDSCLNQTLRPIEIICINDGSTDGTGEILKKYAGEHSEIIILNQTNQGPGAARNLGIAHASGEFIAFMDSDDFYPDKNVLQILYKTAVEENVLVCGGTALFLNDGKVDKADTSLCFQKNTVMYYKKSQSIGGFTRFIYNTQFLVESKIAFPTWRWFEDPPFFIAVMSKADRFYVVRDLVYVIRNTDKVVHFHNKKVVTGIINGIGSILNISRVNRLEELHGNMVSALTQTFCACIYERIYRGDSEIRQCYEKVLEEIDETLLEKDDRKLKKPKAVSDAEINLIFENSLKRERALLDRVNSFDKILIYGAGRAGRLLYQYLLQRGCKMNMEFMISAEHSDYTACGKQVYSIQECVDAKDDALVIIANMCHIGEMEEMARHYEFKHIESVSWNELMFFGADIADNDYLTIF